MEANQETSDFGDELFLVPCGAEAFLLHAPLRHISALVNRTVADEIRNTFQTGATDKLSPCARSLLARLRTAPRACLQPLSGDYAPEHMDLFVTNDCNMRCRYCLAAAGESPPAYMTTDICRTALDFYVETIRRSGRKAMKLVYLGGEPLLAYDVLRFANEYGRHLAGRHGLSFESELTTNGFMSEYRARWMAQNLSHVIVSMDGPPECHDQYRRDLSGRGTHTVVDRTIRILQNEGTPFALRCSVDADRISLLVSMVSFMVRQYRPREVAIEPVLEDGRCIAQRIRSPDPRSFIREAIKAAEIAIAAGVEVVFRNSQPDLLLLSHCSLARDPFVVTCDGYVSACCRIETRQTNGSDQYIMGRLCCDSGCVEMDRARVTDMRSRHVNALATCDTCFAKWHCGGGCRLLQTKAFCGEMKGYLCRITRDLTLWGILKRLNADPYIVEEALSIVT